MRYIISVSKTYKHRGNHFHKRGTKKYWHIFGYEFDEFEETWSMFCEQVNFITAWFARRRKYKRLKVQCPNCNSVNVHLVRKRKHLKKQECQACFETYGDWL